MKLWVLVLLFLSHSVVQAKEQTMLLGYMTSEVTADGMSPTLLYGDYIASSPTYYQEHEIERGDIVLIKSPKNDGSLWIKRIVGLPGETIQTKNGKIYVNDNALIEPYVDQKNNKGWVLNHHERYQPLNDEYFILGDNRINSLDSRHFGVINKHQIVAKAIRIYYSPSISRIGKL